MPKISTETRIMMMNTIRMQLKDSPSKANQYRLNRMLEFHQSKLTEIINQHKISADEQFALIDEYRDYMTPAQEKKYFELLDKEEEKGGPMLQ